jgi:thioredoxin reductase (NADPH)
MGTQNVDILIIGAGPAGLYGAYYAGFRGMSVGLMDSLEEPGGQITAMYPEKAIFDVGGFSSIKGKDLIDNLLTKQIDLDNQVIFNYNKPISPNMYNFSIVSNSYIY